MALTRAQLISGDSAQGVVLPGEVQGVKQGAGVFIATDGTISVDASSVVGLVKLNNASAFNGYVWPNATGTVGQFLKLSTSNALVWGSAGVYVNAVAPPSPSIGDLWFDCTVGELLVYENCTTGAPRWASAADAGYPVLPANTSASPAFASGSGTNLSPYVTSATTVSSGAVVTVINTVTVIGLAPFQFVTITDLNAYVNGGRFSFSNNVADATGTMVFEIIFTDAPVSPNGTTYTANIRVGTRSAYINAGISIVDSFYIVSPGTITGNLLIGSTLTYTPGTYNGGAPPITTSWKWYENTTGTLLQTGGATYVTTASEFGDTVFVVFTATDVNGTVASAPTAQFGPIDRPPFPGPTPPSTPATTDVTSCNTWSSGSTTLQADNCLQFNKNGGAFGQGPTAVINGDTICTRWAPGALCADAPDGTFIDGCLFDTNYSTCGSLTIDRTPASISFTSVTNIVPGAIATAAAITLSGTNAPTYLSYNSGTSTGSLWKVSINGAAAVSLPATPAATLTAPPGANLVFSFTTGTSPTTSYQLVVDAGQVGSGVSGTFTATTGTAGFPNLPPSLAAGPTAIPGTASGTWADGSTTLTSSGCLEFQVNSGPFSQGPTAVNNGDTVTEQWLTTALCGGAASGTTITGTLTNSSSTNSYSLTLDRNPDTFTIAALTGQAISTTATSGVVTLAGTNSATYFTYTAGSPNTLTNLRVSVNSGAYVTVPTSGTTVEAPPGATLQFKGDVGALITTAYTITVNAGTTTAVWSVTTATVTPTITTPSITSPINNATGIDPAVNSPQGVPIVGNTYAPLNGAGTPQTSSTWELVKDNGLPTSAITTVSPVAYSSTLTSTTGFVLGSPATNAFLGDVLQYASASAGGNLVWDASSYNITVTSTLVINNFVRVSNAGYRVLVNGTSVYSGFTASGVSGPINLDLASTLTKPFTLTSLEVRTLSGSAEPSINTLSVDGVILIDGNPTVLTLTDATNLASMSNGDIIKECNSAGVRQDAYGTVIAINSGSSPFTLTLSPSVGTWNTGNFAMDTNVLASPPAGPLTAPQYVAAPGSAYTVSSSPFTTKRVPLANFETSTTYYTRVQYATTNTSAATSNLSNWSSFTTSSYFGPGSSWNDIRSSVSVATIQDMTYSAPTGNFIITGTVGAGGAQAAYSADGLVWTSSTISGNAGYAQMYSVSADNTSAMVVCCGNTSPGQIYYFSTDGGVTWSNPTISGWNPSSTGSYYYPNYAIAGGGFSMFGASYFPPNSVTRSTSGGTNFSAPTQLTPSTAPPRMYGQVGGTNIFIDLSGFNAYVSNDLDTWGSANPTGQSVGGVGPRGGAFGNGLFMVVGTNGFCATSPDGVTWTTKTSVPVPSGGYAAYLVNAGSYWICCTFDSASVAIDNYSSSDNGTTWAKSTNSTTGPVAVYTANGTQYLGLGTGANSTKLYLSN